jgi:Tfp pilus assembly protein PilF
MSGIPMRKFYKPSALSAALVLALCATGNALASPYKPANGAQVIEVLPRRSDPVQRDLHALRSQLDATPKDLALATKLAQRYIAMARSETDPRYLGYAQAALAPWWALPAPPVPVRLLRATILQSNHHFNEALVDLDGVIAIDPNNAQAWLTRATVLTVQGDYPKATMSCARVSNLTNELVTITCISNIATVTGRSVKSEQLLDLTLQRSTGADQELQVWVLTLLAEMATRRGDAATAETRYRRALALSPRDSYLMGAYADFLLDQHRPAEVIALVKDQTRVDALLLRRALALQQLPGQEKALAADTADLDARFNAAMQRGDTVHQREQARFELFLRHDPARALDLARKNWDVQREAADVRIYLEAAEQSADPAAADTVVNWIRSNKVEDVATARLMQRMQQHKGGA